MNKFKTSWLGFWKKHRTFAYLCVTAIMAIVGFVLFGLLGFLAEASLSWLSGKPLNYGMAFLLALCGGGLFALSVYVKNPLITILDCLEKEMKQ